MELVPYIGVGMFMAGVIYQLGRFAARLEALESWRTDIKVELNQIYQALRHIEDMVRAEKD